MNKKRHLTSAPLRQGFSDFGYAEPMNMVLENRFAAEHYDRFDGLARELVERKVDVLIAVTFDHQPGKGAREARRHRHYSLSRTPGIADGRLALLQQSGNSSWW
jgi:hypothetical protein